MFPHVLRLHLECESGLRGAVEKRYNAAGWWDEDMKEGTREVACWAFSVTTERDSEL